MALFVIADLHLSGKVNKSMEVFGARWIGYVKKLESNWRKVVGENDTVVIPGDFSWGMTLEEALPDFAFLNSLPGKKLIGKGNHDFWWTTANKMNAFLREHKFKTISFLHNNAYEIDGILVAGSRGWFLEETTQRTVGPVNYHKIINRELGRLRASIIAAEGFNTPEETKTVKVFLHFPPVFGDMICEEILSCLSEFHVKDCYFGHIHGVYSVPSVTEYRGIRFHFISADYLNFCPRLVNP